VSAVLISEPGEMGNLVATLLGTGKCSTVGTLVPTG
jgi:hypothetical protein